MSNKKLILNVTNQIINKDVDSVKEMSEYDFWYYYLSLLNINRPVLSNKELYIMTYILTGDPSVSFFRGKEREKFLKDVQVKTTNLSKYVESLVSKGFLQFQGTRGDYLVSPSLRKFQIYIKENLQNNIDISYIFTSPLKIKA